MKFADYLAMSVSGQREESVPPRKGNPNPVGWKARKIQAEERYRRVMGDQWMTTRDIEKKLGEIFSFDQMDMIELTFEKTECPAFVENQIESADMRRRCHEFGIEHRSKNELLIAIMRNIIEHDGEFIP
jgi:hypothetical protein